MILITCKIDAHPRVITRQFVSSARLKVPRGELAVVWDLAGRDQRGVFPGAADKVL